MRILLCCLFSIGAAVAAGPAFDYQLLATNRVSTMEKEMNEAAQKGYRYSNFIGGETSFGGDEVVVVMSKPIGGIAGPLKSYKLLAASVTSSLDKELRAAGEAGFEYKGTIVFRPSTSSKEALVVMEQGANTTAKFEYKVLAAARTSTMQKELQTAGQGGYRLLGVTLSETRLGVGEVVAILGKDGQ